MRRGGARQVFKRLLSHLSGYGLRVSGLQGGGRDTFKLIRISSTAISAPSTVKVMRPPPGDPMAKKGLLLWSSTSVGDMDERGCLPPEVSASASLPCTSALCSALTPVAAARRRCTSNHCKEVLHGQRSLLRGGVARAKNAKKSAHQQRARAHAHTHTYMHTNTHIHIHTCTHAHMHTYTRDLVREQLHGGACLPVR